jgi:hypothetical protein
MVRNAALSFSDLSCFFKYTCPRPTSKIGNMNPAINIKTPYIPNTADSIFWERYRNTKIENTALKPLDKREIRIFLLSNFSICHLSEEELFTKCLLDICHIHS